MNIVQMLADFHVRGQFRACGAGQSVVLTLSFQRDSAFFNLLAKFGTPCVRSFYHVHSFRDIVLEYMDSVQTIIISRFILSLRRADQRNRTVPSNLSQFAASGIGMPSFGNISGEMGGPLDHGPDEAEEPQGGPSDGVMEAGPPGTQWHEGGAGA